MKKEKFIKKNNYIYIYGKHAAFAALENRNRFIAEVFFEHKNIEFEKKIIDIIKNYRPKLIMQKTSKNIIDSMLGTKIKHQGILLKAQKLQPNNYRSIFKQNNNISYGVYLDNLNDPQNVGAIYRSAYMFNFSFILTSLNKNPIETNSLLNAASGAYEKIKTLYGNNVLQIIKEFKKSGWWVVGLDYSAKINLNQFIKQYGKERRLLFFLGSEGKGIRRIIKENCDILVKINTKEQKLSLNVSNTAAIVFDKIYNRI
ncbi:MAG: putative tRNA/rRNA methyltransferase [Alphaproteobacteria bacterium MarineAlpha9_Bin4]|nr:MAG: putative tRNA/rRNA methyltransferase [Alphaproteobacteria bacterium MarineAlpha9_Bin4]|tara:strand:+ start:1372 stop:2142 length:771 start_codon:yes stop_codon:yes gene_type:complete